MKTAAKSNRGTSDRVHLSAATSENPNDADEEESKSAVRTRFNVDEAIKEMQNERFFQREFAKDLKKFKRVEEMEKSKAESIEASASRDKQEASEENIDKSVLIEKV